MVLRLGTIISMGQFGYIIIAELSLAFGIITDSVDLFINDWNVQWEIHIKIIAL